MKLILLGRIPSKKNSRILICRGKRPISIPNGKYTAWHKEMSLSLSNQGKKQLIGATSIIITLFFPDHRRTDLINKCEGILDLLVDNEIITDDDWLHTGSVHMVPGGVDKLQPRAEIEIIENPEIAEE